MRKDKPAIGKVLLVVCGINLFLSVMINVQMPYMITEVLNLGVAQANKLYGFLFEICKGFEFIVILFAGLISLIIAISTKNIFKKLLSYRA